MACAFLNVQAQQPSKNITDSLILSLQEVKVSAINYRELLSPVSAQIIKVDQLKLRTLSVADAVRFFAGIQLKDYGGVGGLKTINVRSMGTNHTAVFYDGIQLNNAQNGQVDLGRFALTNLEEISLYSGQKPQILLPARAFATASSIYLKTKAPVFSDGKKQNYEIAFKGGSFGLLNPSGSFQQKVTDKISWSLTADYLEANGNYKFRYKDYDYDLTSVRQNGDITSNRIETGLFGITRDSSYWNVKFYQYRSERGLPGAIVSNKFTFSQRQADDNFFVQASLESSRNKRYSYLFNTKYAYDFLRYTDPEYVADYTLVNTYAQQEYYFSFANQYKLFPVFNIALSADYSRQNLDTNLSDFAYPTRHTSLVALSSSFKKGNLDIQGNLLTTVVKEDVKSGSASRINPQYNPSILLSWQPKNSSNFSVRAFYKSIFRLPTFNDLYYTLIGNNNLQPEYTKQFNIGFSKSFTPTSRLLHYVDVKADVYYNDVTDKIVAIPTLNLFRWTMMNLDRAKIKGFALSTNSSWILRNDLRINTSLNYTYEEALDYSAQGFTYKQQIPYSPLHSGSARFGIIFQQYSINYAYIYTGERYSQKANIPKNYVQPWYTHDVSLSRNFNLRNRQKMELGVELSNLFNQYYDVIANYPMPGLNYRIHCNYKF